MSNWKLSSSAPDANRNGLDDPVIVRALLDDPNKLRLVVALVSVDEIKRNVVTGIELPVVKIRHIEIPPADHAKIVTEILHQAHQDRTGEMMLPFEPGALFTLPGMELISGDDDDNPED